MSDFKAKMQKIQFLMGFRPRPGWGACVAPTDPLAVFKGPTSKGRERGKGKGMEWKGKGRGTGKEEEGPAPPKYFGLEPHPTGRLRSIVKL